MSVTNYPIKKLLAQHFQGPVSDGDYNYRTVPTLLRAIADWMDKNDLQDPEFDEIKVRVVWERANTNDISEGDPFYYAATVYYLEPESK